MACVSRPKPPTFWGNAAVLLLLAVHVGSEAQQDLPSDSLYLDPRYQYNPSAPFQTQGQRQGQDRRSQTKPNQRSFGQSFDPFGQFPANQKPVSELNLDEALEVFLKTQDPKYFQYYQGGDPRDGANPSRPGSLGPSGSPLSADPQIASLLKQIDQVGSQQCTGNVLAQWNFETNVNEVTQLEAVSTHLIYEENIRQNTQLVTFP